MTSQEKEELKNTIRKCPHSKIENIKLVRDKHGLGLKEAKDLVDSLYVELGNEDPVFFKEQKSNKGCFALIAFGLIAYSAFQFI